MTVRCVRLAMMLTTKRGDDNRRVQVIRPISTSHEISEKVHDVTKAPPEWLTEHIIPLNLPNGALVILSLHMT